MVGCADGNGNEGLPPVYIHKNNSLHFADDYRNAFDTLPARSDNVALPAGMALLPDNLYRNNV